MVADLPLTPIWHRPFLQSASPHPRQFVDYFLQILKLNGTQSRHFGVFRRTCVRADGNALQESSRSSRFRAACAVWIGLLGLEIKGSVYHRRRESYREAAVTKCHDYIRA
ncbi:hypothetical protein GWI33_013779 [Rhynchophorus ferrugineus]|uniref:Uncharacterized protein n=1 Tax=Rhynchophorus ferrugineus TaxID=354439 RepID=A0A834I8J4_RHYFE|nr:hypothetical protein GWI33_013779 [Rhynchophorus ferrugineus]